MAQGTEPDRLPEIRLSRVFRAPRATVFEAWSSPDHVKRWFCPAGFTVPQARVEMHAGGAFEVCMRSPEGVDFWTRGRFTGVVPHERLAIEMHAIGDDDRRLFSAITLVTFADAPGGTRMDVLQTYTLHDPAGRPMLAGAPVAWHQTLDRLEAEVARMRSENDAARSVVHATFRLERVYDTPAARVWRALTDQDAKAAWFGGAPGQWEVMERQMDVRVGGRERLKGRWQGGTVSTFDAVYHDVVPQRRLVYAYDMHLDDRKISVSLATVQLRAEGARTRLAVTEQGAFLDGYDDAGARERGTGVLLDALGAALRA